jgi:hypothetical protein
MAVTGYRRKLVPYAVVAIAFSYAIIVGIYLTPARAFGLSDEGVALILGRVSLIPYIVGPVAGLVVLLLIPEESWSRWCYAAFAVIGFLTPVFVPAIAAA